MIALIQRVSQAKVDVNGETIGKIGKRFVSFAWCRKKKITEKKSG